MARVSMAFAVAYPFLVYLTTGRLRARWIALVLAAAAGARLLAAARGRWTGALRGVLPGLVTVLVLAGVAAVTDSQLLVLAMPALVSFGLLWVFASSLRTTPIIERFAQAQVQKLSPEELRYCRSVTLVWCGFFLVNGVVALALATGRSLLAWTVYTGLVSYLLIGCLFAAEWLTRKWRFRRYEGGPLDVVVRRVFPPRIP